MQQNSITPLPNYVQNAGYNGNCVNNYTGPKEEQIYWFHPDHLGSSSYITGVDGEVTQNIEYFPSGEVFVENHNKASNNSPYKFNAKELDAETGYYYRARYYNPRVSLWLNMDPLAEKFAGRSPYEYTFSNPIKFIDPLGLEGKGVIEVKNGKETKISNVGDDIGVDFLIYKDGKNQGKVGVRDQKTGKINLNFNPGINLNVAKRGNSVDWKTITDEFFSGTGPTRSLFSGNHPAIQELSSDESNFAYEARSNFMEKGGNFGGVYIDYTPIVWNLESGHRMWEQMMGSTGVEWYRLGDNILYIMTDQKNKKSWYLHLPVKNVERTKSRNGSWTYPEKSTTHQLYMWMEPVSVTEKKYKTRGRSNR